MNLTEIDAVEVLSLFREGKLTPEAYAEALVDCAEKNKAVNALQFFDADMVIRAAKQCDELNSDLLLSGLPVVVKDSINTTSYPTTGGTFALLENIPQDDAVVVSQLAAQGAYVGAKAGMHELALGITSNNYATGPVCNPHSAEMIAGGSSGGTAAAIAAGIFPVGLGTDTGGSCRIPAALCGVVGYRPSMGRYSNEGVIPVASSRDTVGTLARSVRDVALLDSVLARNTIRPVDLDGKQITLGVPSEMFYEDLDPYVKSVIDKQIQILADSGFKLIDVSFGPIWDQIEAASFPVVFYELMRDLPLYLESHAPDVSFQRLISEIASPDVSEAFELQQSGQAIAEEEYKLAMDTLRPAMRQVYEEQFAKHSLDAIVFPTTPLPARPIGQDKTVYLNGRQVPIFQTYIRNTDLSPNIGSPSISLPCPVFSGLPVGIELDGLPGEDEKLLAIAQVVESTLAK